VHHAAAREEQYRLRLRAELLREAAPRFRHKSAQVDECPERPAARHDRAVQASQRVRHEDHVLGVAESALDRVRVVLESQTGVLTRQIWDDHLVAPVPEGPDETIPAPGAVPGAVDKREDAHVLLVLWDIDGTLVDSAGHGRHAFEEAFQDVVGGVPEWVEYAGRTDHQIALEMLNGSAEHLPALLDQLAERLAARRELIASEGRVYPGVPETLAALHETDGV